MDLETIKVWLMVITLLSTAGQGVWLFLKERSDKTDERVDELTAKVGQIDKDVTSLAASSGKAPNHSDLSNVYKSINELAETVNQLVGENRGQSDTLRLILNQIMQKGLS